MDRSIGRTLSLSARVVAALVFVGAVSLVIGATAVLAAGLAVVLPLTLLLVVFAPPLVGASPGWLWPHSAGQLLVASFLVGLVLAPRWYIDPIRQEIRAFEAELGTTGTPAEERHPKIASMARRLAQQADVPEPEVRIVNRRRPESYALADGGGGTIVITRGVIRQLDDDEVEAVLAHEVSHLANRDSRLLRWLLVPMLVAEYTGSERPTLESGSGQGYAMGMVLLLYPLQLVAWKLLSMLTLVQLRTCQLGVALLSRGRERAADSAAVRLTGSPATLASALGTLDDARSRPSEDKRDFMRTAGVLDILPVEDRSLVDGPFRTHPRTETRIARLESLVKEMEQ